ncbi:MAG: RNA polymerase sigma factor [Muribaculaceae bacterium]|nr:RNA polymerase sigma factor [Muribaculaceae bacterium]MDE5958512.1 RNA polymerase sigma factor [Muribaculaceae bacterium]MDE6448128.1 RNA polymerase sigma factor [Muribaculaceae bacterium]
MFKKPNRNNISKIIEDNLDYLVRFAYYRIGNHAEAEDLVYDAVLRFLEKAPEDIKPESVRLYLFRIVYNLCLDSARTGRNDRVTIDGIDIEDRASDIIDLEDADRINACLDSLPQREADVIRMNVIDNLSFVEISGVLSIPQSTAKSRYKSGMDKLRKLFINNKLS